MQQLHPKAVWLFFINGALSWLLILLFFIVPVSLPFVSSSFEGYGTKQADWFLIGFIIAVILGVVLSIVWSKLSYRYYRYELTANSFRKEHGVIWKRYTTIPYDRIQNVDIIRGLLARILGLSDLHIQTAGMSGTVASEGRLPGIAPDVAEQLRDELIERARRAPTIVAGQEISAAAQPTISQGL